MPTEERLPVLHHSADFIFHFLWDHWVLCGSFENGVLLMHILGGVNSVNYCIVESFLSEICSFFPKVTFCLYGHLEQTILV